MFDKILYEAQSITPVSEESARDYRQKQSVLCQYVDNRISKHDNLSVMLGGNMFQLLADNHLNHVRFMSNVFLLNSFVMLARVIPWVYRAYHKQGVAYGYFPLALQSWMQAISLSLAPQAAAELLPTYQWMLSHHEDFVAAAEDSQQIPFDFKFENDEWNKILLQKLLLGDFECFTELTLQFLQAGNSVESLYINLLQPCLYEVGRLWEIGDISVAQEHLSTAIVNRTMFQVFGHYRYPAEKKGKVLIAAAPNEYHEIGAHMVADLLLLDGWEVVYLGANMPQDDLLEYLGTVKPIFLGLSAVLPFNIEYVRNIIAAIKAAPDLSSVKVMVGGLAFSLEPSIWKKIGADAYAANGVECVQTAREWWETFSDAVG